MIAPVVAFLQNCWFRPNTPRHIIDLYQTDQRYRRKVLELSMTGKRLRKAFGARYSEIWWDNASQHVATYASGKSAADPQHMWNVMSQVQPRGVICFGTVAAGGMTMLSEDPSASLVLPPVREGRWHAFPHPCAFGLTQSQIDEFAAEIISRYF